MKTARSDSVISNMLLSLIPLSCMIAPIREIANTNNFSTTSAISIPNKCNDISKDICINASRERSNMLSLNWSKRSLAHSSISSISYEIKIKAQSNYPIWIKHIEAEIFNLSYMLPKREKTSIHIEANSSNNMPLPCVEYMSNTSVNVAQSNSLNFSSISYIEN